jgi:hypothetical protein
MSVNIKQIKVGKMDNFTYVIYSGGDAVIVVPSWGYNDIKSFLDEKKLSPVI